MSLRISEVAGVALVELDRPPVNAMDLEMVLAMETAFLRLQDQPTKGLVLGACGRAFSAGVDTRAFAASSPQDKADLVVAITRMITAALRAAVPGGLGDRRTRDGRGLRADAGQRCADRSR